VAEGPPGAGLMAKLKKNTPYVVDGFDEDGQAIFREASFDERHGRRKHLEMFFAPLISKRDKEMLEAKANLLGEDKNKIANALRVPEALLKP
jgi:hypothetical protein